MVQKNTGRDPTRLNNSFGAVVKQKFAVFGATATKNLCFVPWCHLDKGIQDL